MTSARNSAAPRFPARRRGAFTLLELMLVLALIAIVFLSMTPLVTATMREKKLRAGAESIEEMVRRQRADAQGDGRQRLVEIRAQGFYERTAKGGRDEVLGAPAGADLYVRMPGEKWEKPSGQYWEFSPVGMVTPLSVRLENGRSWMEVDFDMLTGRVAEERYAF